MAEKLEVLDTGYDYRVGEWSFDEEDRDLAYCDAAIAAWTAWREYVAEELNGAADKV